MSWMVSETLFVLLVWGALGLSGVGAVLLLGVFVRDVRRKSTW
ncbi:MAG: hypothetical protein AAFU79_26835 [Myxococcota bacterium]